MASFLAKTVRDRLRMIQKKKMLSFQSIQTQHGKGNSRKIAKKFKKLKKKKSLWPLFKPKRDGTG